MQNIARELVELYAVRQEKEGYVCGPDTVWQREFEEMFPYEETEDQLAAIEDTKKDMESTKIMDRLVCGDVGYGKTEVALRAAFKAVQESRQVVYLVPTTILAQQVYNGLVAGSLLIAKDQDSYAYLPKALAEKIEQKMTGFILLNQQSEQNTQMTDEEDPYAAYVIPDDLMW